MRLSQCMLWLPTFVFGAAVCKLNILAKLVTFSTFFCGFLGSPTFQVAKCLKQDNSGEDSVSLA